MTEQNNYCFTDTAVTVLKERYLLKDPDTGEQETIPDMFRRVAFCVAAGDIEKADRYYTMMMNRDFLPNSPTLMNAGKEGKAGQLSACYVLPVEDSMEGIFEALKNMAVIHKSGGGTGFNFSNLRHKGARVGTTNGLASGPVSFMGLFDQATECVMQGGMRRGANMGILDIDHPDILEFIEAKGSGQLTNFNLSIGMTDEFMKNLDDPWNHDLWMRIVRNAWKSGDPGLVFLDEVNRHNHAPELGDISATNPCGECPMHSFEACNLGSINLSNFVEESPYYYYTPHTYQFEGRYIDLDRLAYTVTQAVEFLNGVIDANHYPLPEIESRVKELRTIGLGVMGWADTLNKLGIRYGSEESFKLADFLMSYINGRAHDASKGRNAAVTCIAPTGTISLIAGCSSGIEPLFALEYDRVAFDKDADADGTSHRKVLHYVDPNYQEALEAQDIRLSDGIFVTANEVTWKEHIDMLSTFQKYTDLAVSKTINMPNSATVDDVSEAYIYAWQRGCKGITIFRDGCLGTQVLYRKDPESAPEEVGVEGDVCPECGSTSIVRESGCKKCTTCGWSPCAI